MRIRFKIKKRTSAADVFFADASEETVRRHDVGHEKRRELRAEVAGEAAHHFFLLHRGFRGVVESDSG